MKKMRQLFVLFLVTMLLWGCGLAGEDEPDYWPTQSWKTSSPESQGMDSSILLNMLEVIWERDIKIDSVLVVRNGYAVLDAYSYPRDKDDRHNIYSCSKSVTSALIGIAIDKGFIKGVDRPVLDFFPEHVAKNLSEDKKAMTLEDLLTMTTGLECRDNYRHRWVGLRQMEMSPDWVQFMIDLPMAEKPASGMLPGEYVNNEYGFSAKYDARLMVTDDKLQPGVVFRRKGVEGVPMFNVVVEDIPRGVELKDTGELLIEEFRKIPQIRDPEIRKQQLITLPDGTGANYGEITWKYRSYDMQTVAVAVFKDGKIIGVSVSGTAQMPTEYLTDMAKSLRLKK